MTGVVRMLGRDDELRVIMDAMEAAAPLVLVVGDAGIGKSRLVATAVENARDQGVLALVGGCVSLSGKLPLLPFVQALAGMDDTVALPLLGRISPPLRHALAVLMPGRVVETSVGLESPRASVERPGAWERERLVLAVAALLSPPARTLPTVVVIEDLHWADPFTLDLLTYLVAGTRTGATLVATLRTDQRPMPPVVVGAIAELQRLEGTVTVELGPLPTDVIAQQAEELLGPAGSPRLVADLVQLGGGNPFFTEQLCRQASITGSAESRSVAGTLPAQLSAFLQSRVRWLTEPARRALLVLAVAGTPLSAAELATAAELSERDAADVVRELSDAALLAPAETTHVAPRHALLAAAVTEAADPVTLAWAHARLGSLLDSTGNPARAVASAGHWAAAGRERGRAARHPRRRSRRGSHG